MSARKVSKIDVVNEFIDENNKIIKKKRVCAYARVSTKELEQLASLCNQIEAYEEQIKNNPEWEFAGMFYDKGFSGTSMKKRVEFQRMMDHAKNGDIDMIITKSISRFARNTIDTLSMVRELKKYNVEVFFETEGLSSFHTHSEFILTILASVAQEEARIQSEKVRWGIAHRFKHGVVRVGGYGVFGFDKDENKNLIVNKKEARMVRKIFDMFLSGTNITDLVIYLNKNKVPKHHGRKTEWNATHVTNLLRNEKYCGDALLQKTITLDYLTHKALKNDNIAPKYYVSNNHDGIVTKKVFKAVQTKLDLLEQQKRDSTNVVTSRFLLTGMVYCGLCRRTMRKHYTKKTKNGRTIFLDCNHDRGECICKQSRLNQKFMEEIIYEVVKKVIGNQVIYDDFIDQLQNSKNRMLQPIRDKTIRIMENLKSQEELVIEDMEYKSIIKMITVCSREDIVVNLFTSEASPIALLENREYMKVGYEFPFVSANKKLTATIKIVVS